MSARIPLRKRLLVRLLIASGLIAVCSVAATAWLAVETTTRALREEQGQVLADDMDVLARLSGYAATHPDWSGVRDTVRELSAKTGRRIALTTADRTPIADSAPRGTALPVSAAATVDPLRVDTYSERGAQLGGTDPRAVGPYRLTEAERTKVEGLARARQRCFARHGIDLTMTRTPSGRPVLTGADGSGDRAYVPDECADGLFNTPTPTERKALAALEKLAGDCLVRAGLDPAVPLFLGVDSTPAARGVSDPPTFAKADADVRRAARPCLDRARRAQLDPYVAPAAHLFLGGGGDAPAVRFDMSAANKAKVVGAAGLVLAVTVAVTAVVATRLVRPLRALTEAARQPPERHVRVPVTTRDETGILAAAFNALTERRERLEVQRRAMVSDIAHELRTPLTNIRGWLEVTRDGVVDPDPALLAALHDEALVLQRVIDDLRDLADADAGTLRLHREPVRCDELLDQVAAAHRVAADAAGVVLRTTVEGEPWLDADRVRMRQALGNLVSNALRHTPADGTVTLAARPDGDDVLLEVTDTGTGIAPGDLPHVFDRFWRAEKSRSRRTGGSGLGLPIVRHLVAAHGGTAVARSEPGAGSVFTLRLPGASPR
ncbi:sensor histidine kinase [Streptomyces lincolnensis]|uniref:histidine kinase n=1 Tax=Streptomyces lincolnensis TaxID=1915 RepID=A0A1B1M206_STRLN|nr:HAMP domain-containing sensor histidine kinase [Streptomyces lincolnensis]ANS62680.1 sensor histidine kinase [Streptomyces lincolnensis]AXG51605.1 sensor histidine kinase [Streptomyces lincolnensis]QMV04626.1 HAMP domain-containing protein [Streptomyces lincolnensis]QMV11699.1 HAMP domain-containing protein [Streptomyces lincolnensis]